MALLYTKSLLCQGRAIPGFQGTRRHPAGPGLHPGLLRRQPHAGEAVRADRLVPAPLEGPAGQAGLPPERPGEADTPYRDRDW